MNVGGHDRWIPWIRCHSTMAGNSMSIIYLTGENFLDLPRLIIPEGVENYLGISGGFQKIWRYPKNGWFIRGNPINMDDLIIIVTILLAAGFLLIFCFPGLR